MLPINWYYIMYIISVAFSLSLIIWTLRNILRSPKELQKLKSPRIWDMLVILSMSFLPPGTINGKKKSAFERLYKKYLSSAALFTKEPQLVKVFGIPLGLAVYDYESLREIVQCDSCSDRGPYELLKLYSNGKRPGGILFNSGKTWREIRKHTMKKLGILGFGKISVMSTILADQLPDLLDRIDTLKSQTGNKIQATGLFSLTLVNVIWCIAGGTKFSEGDPVFKALYNATCQLTNAHFFSLWGLSIFQNVRIVRDIFGYGRFRNAINVFSRTFKNFINEREVLGVYKENPENFVDHFLLEIEKHKGDTQWKDVYSTEQLVSILQDLFMGGMDTSSKFLETTFMYMVLYPEIQLKVQKEIDAVLGENLPLYPVYKKKMPYSIATMMEVHRMASIISLSPRYVTEDFTFGRHHLKKGAFVGLLYFALRMDEDYWKDADVFRPERFLDANQNVIQERVNRLLTFGIGSHACVGENISMSTSFTIFVGVLRKYTITKADKAEILGMKETFGFVNGPGSFHISVFER